MKIQLDMYQTLAIAVLVLMLGTFLKKESSFWKILYTFSCYRRTLICNFHLHLLQYGIGRIFL